MMTVATRFKLQPEPLAYVQIGRFAVRIDFARPFMFGPGTDWFYVGWLTLFWFPF